MHSTIDRDLYDRQSACTVIRLATYALPLPLVQVSGKHDFRMHTCDKMGLFGGNVRDKSCDIVWSAQIPDAHLLPKLRRDALTKV
jgi:hypothetical protein